MKMQDNNQVIAKKVHSLDETRPAISWQEDELWDHIEGKMEARTNLRRVLYAAACAGISITIALVLHFSEPRAVTIAHSFETNVEENVALNEEYGQLETSALEFIRTNCEREVEACKTTEFKALTDELDVLEGEIAALDEMITNYGDDPSFIKSKIQIENLRSEIIGELVQMILS